MNENNEVFSMEDEPVATRDTEYAQRLQMALRIFGKLPSATGRGTLPDGQEVAEMLRVSRRTLQEYRNNRMLPFILLAGKVLYPESGLRELLRRITSSRWNKAVA